jgi:hypothetical protein
MLVCTQEHAVSRHGGVRRDHEGLRHASNWSGQTSCANIISAFDLLAPRMSSITYQLCLFFFEFGSYAYPELGSYKLRGDALEEDMRKHNIVEIKIRTFDVVQ